MPDDLFWKSTPYEVRTLTDKIVERHKARERAATLRAGLVASAVYNVHRKKGTRMIKPTDFVRSKPAELSPDQVREHLLSWARAVNQQHEA